MEPKTKTELDKDTAAVKAGMKKQAKKLDSQIETEMEKGVTRGPKAKGE